MSVNQNLAEGLSDQLRQYGDVIRGHDAVHPDRDVCGGVGGCGLMRAEAEIMEEIRDRLDALARRTNVKVTVTVTGLDRPSLAV